MYKIRFDDTFRQHFEAASGDHNPLHNDPDFARQSPFAKPVVHGVGATILALSYWARGQQFAIKKIDITFHRPIYYDTSYNLVVAEDENKVVINCGLGKRPLLSIRMTTLPDANPESDPNNCSEQITIFLEYIGMTTDQMPCEQVNALLWASYYFGMKNPGHRGVLAEIQFCFRERPKQVPTRSFVVHSIDVKEDNRYSHYRISAETSVTESVRIVGFRIPERRPLELSQLTEGSAFSGEHHLITGAGRGFGHCLAHAVARKGAMLWLNSLSDIGTFPEEMLRHVVTGNIADPDVLSGITRSLAGKNIKLSKVFAAAFPVTPALFFDEITPIDFLAQLNSGLNTILLLAKEIIPHIADGGMFVLISSTFVEVPSTGQAVYVTAKAAAEALIMTLAREYPHIRFVTARLPPMLTDRTNVPWHTTQPQNVEAITCRLLDKVKGWNESSNYAVWNLSKPGFTQSVRALQDVGIKF
jgi:NAD(P)-dependent dehydrogenase (short-subunit alcohol dehydrogenase family)